MKMKIGISTILLLLGVALTAQNTSSKFPINPETKKIEFQEVVQQEGIKDELFNRSIYWLNDFYKSPVRVTSLRDIETGKIVGQHRFRIYYTDKDGNKIAAGMIGYDFMIELKQDRYRYTLNNFLLKSATRQPVEKWLKKENPAYDIRWNEYLDQIAEFVENWSKSLKEKMKPEAKKAPDDW